ncbi:hypothetical protein OKA05_16940 [Luteolibacter arcticus]|uniref:Uncharacterized protein n=1 Tax=Luteolibacter arcticus TaxID=1581411 RepID=A0ABT3GL59_9BACT|nr:hypothetical protein [Luteolibacter arcticus]MCW1924255.1 hypothetical protein [Luteolibacter arcticus]
MQAESIALAAEERELVSGSIENSGDLVSFFDGRAGKCELRKV